MMLEKFSPYFQAIEMPGPLVERAEKICKLFGPLLPGPIDKVFICDSYELPAAIRRYNSIYLVSKDKLMECKNFVVEDRIDFVSLKKGCDYIDMTAKNLTDLNGPTTVQSSLNVSISFKASTLNATLHGAHNNCKYLLELYMATFLPLMES